MEALIAIFILTVSVASMLGVTATSTSYSRYANNEITANYLLQEAVDSIRNSRDTIAFKMNEDLLGQGWTTFLNRYGYKDGVGSDRCFSSNGCYLKMEEFLPTDVEGTDKAKFLSGNDVYECASSTSCASLNYNSSPNTAIFYSYIPVNESIGISQSIFSRKVLMELVNPYELKITATVTWSNGNGQSVLKTQKLEMSLLNWQS